MSADKLSEFQPLDPPKAPGVYAIADDRGHVKIGRAKSIRHRLNRFQCAHATPLRLLAVLSSDPEDERSFHNLAAPHRVLGEWFKAEGIVLDLIREASVREDNTTASLQPSIIHSLARLLIDRYKQDSTLSVYRLCVNRVATACRPPLTVVLDRAA